MQQYVNAVKRQFVLLCANYMNLVKQVKCSSDVEMQNSAASCEVNKAEWGELGEPALNVIESNKVKVTKRSRDRKVSDAQYGVGKDW